MASVADKYVCTGAILAGKAKRFNQSVRSDKAHERVSLLAGRLEAGLLQKASAKGRGYNPWLRDGYED